MKKYVSEEKLSVCEVEIWTKSIFQMWESFSYEETYLVGELWSNLLLEPREVRSSHTVYLAPWRR